VSELVPEADRITVLTGAGISTASGIPDFRGPQGLWTKNPAAQAMFDLDSYISDRDARVQLWRLRVRHPAWTAEPNAAHLALVELEHQGRLRAIVTQNVDGLHQKAGSSPALVQEIHGTIWFVDCLSCGRRLPIAEVIPRLDAGEDDPQCLDCGGILKPATVSFGQSLDRDVLDASVEAARDCDLFVAIGTSLEVYTAAGLCDVALDHGARLVIVNAEPTPYDDLADEIFADPIEQIVPSLFR
jgi:NAD-dependent protein deacetylase/lipoamidase